MDSGPAFRDELKAKKELLLPLLQGLRGWADLADELPPGPVLDDLVQRINGAIARFQDQITAIDATLNAIDVLYGTGYPETPTQELTPEQLTLLQTEEASLEASLGVFTTTTPAVTLEVPIGSPIPKET